MTLRFDYLSPLPPVRSGISDYSVDLLPHLRARADVRVLRLPDLPLDEAIAERFAIRDGAEAAGEGGRLPLYQMGNNRFHLAIWELACRRPGVVVLHDLVLHHFLLDRTVGHGDWAGYRDELARCHGWIGEAVAGPVRRGAFGLAGQFELPANRTLLERQHGVIVHGSWAAERLAEEDSRLAVRVVPMGVPLPPEASRERAAAFRLQRGIPEAALLLGSFGFQTPIKRTDVAIRALARPGFEALHLLIAGELSPHVTFGRLAGELGVADRVHVTGFLPFEELDAAIAASDLCLNLRYPSAGETSASLLRILAVGRPVVVSAYADTGDLPPDVALSVPLGDDEAESFAAVVGGLLGAGRQALAERGRRARRHVAEEHAPERAAERLLAAASELATLVPAGERVPEPPPRSSTTTSRPRGELRLSGLAGWRPGERRRLQVEVENRGPGFWLPSRELPGGVQFEVQLWIDGVDRWHGRPGLMLQTAVAPGERRELALELRRPLEPARLLIRPTIALAGRQAPFGDWVLDQWL